MRGLRGRRSGSPRRLPAVRVAPGPVRTVAILPVKSFDAAKQRLAATLGAGSRQALAQAMFQDVLATVGRVPAVTKIVLVTGESAAAFAAPDDAVVLTDDEEAGQSAAVAIGVRWALAEGFERVVMVPGDTPLLEGGELEELIGRPEKIVIVPDRAGTGTNALVLTPPDAIETAFGPGSLERHVTAARASGLDFAVVEAASLMHDVDTPEDLDALAQALEQQRVTAPRTRGAIRQLDRAGARL